MCVRVLGCVDVWCVCKCEGVCVRVCECMCVLVESRPNLELASGNCES